MRSVLIANRGEIAVRIVRACRELGLRSIAIHSAADRDAPHVHLADEAHPVGPAPSSESYLRIDRILEVARRSGADAIHPGYGFLSERAAFAAAVAEAGLVFVGPSAEAIAAMGDKAEARRRMEEAGVPLIPGVSRPVRDEEADALAADVGYPILLKAVAGGGGKGMRVVADPAELPRALAAARREAMGAFGDDGIYMERRLERPRHIEIQILGDRHGRVIHLGERECSIQRRHQKVVEEAPSPALDPALRARMGETAVRAAAALGYTGAGTIEFLYQDGEFYFLEMNTRIQVEHPVTELVAGVDLVRWQLRIAAGESLDLAQEDVALSGHAIECRITAEDPARGFLPGTGRIAHLEIPSGPGVRWDGGIAQGTEVGLHYDPLLAKLVVHADSRDEAIARMARALDELVVAGVPTSAPFLRRVMDEADFRAGELSTGYVDEHPDLLAPRLGERERTELAALAALLEAEHRDRGARTRIESPTETGLPPWRTALHPWMRRP